MGHIGLGRTYLRCHGKGIAEHRHAKGAVLLFVRDIDVMKTMIVQDKMAVALSRLNTFNVWPSSITQFRQFEVVLKLPVAEARDRSVSAHAEDDFNAGGRRHHPD